MKSFDREILDKKELKIYIQQQIKTLPLKLCYRNGKKKIYIVYIAHKLKDLHKILHSRHSVKP